MNVWVVMVNGVGYWINKSDAKKLSAGMSFVEVYGALDKTQGQMRYLTLNTAAIAAIVSEDQLGPKEV